MSFPKVFCTVTTFSHLYQAITLVQSVQKMDTGSSFYILLAEDSSSDIIPQLQQRFEDAGIIFVTLGQLGEPIEKLKRMAFYYTSFELCCALRGYLHRYLLNNTEHESWLFLDGDTYALASFQDVFEQLQSANILLSPHRQKVLDVVHAPNLEWNILWAGVYNGGFLGIHRTTESLKFIDWFCARLERYAHVDSGSRGWNGDQLWLNLVPHLFENVQIVKISGVNIGHWNLFDASFTYRANDAGEFLYNEKPLVLFHFSGWSLDCPDNFSAYASKEQTLQQAQREAWKKLSEQYVKALNANRLTGLPEYSFSRFLNGKEIKYWMRRHYYVLYMKNNARHEKAPFDEAKYFSNTLRLKLVLLGMLAKFIRVWSLIYRKR